MLFVALAIVATMTVLLSFVFMTAWAEADLHEHFADCTRAMTFHASAMFCFVFLLYFDLRRRALLIVAAYAVLNTALHHWRFLSLGRPYYGYGSMVAAAATFRAGIHRAAARAAVAALPRLYHQQPVPIRSTIACRNPFTVEAAWSSL